MAQCSFSLTEQPLGQSGQGWDVTGVNGQGEKKHCWAGQKLHRTHLRPSTPSWERHTVTENGEFRKRVCGISPCPGWSIRVGRFEVKSMGGEE